MVSRFATETLSLHTKKARQFLDGLVNFCIWRRRWDSNPRWLVTTLDFESSTLNRSDTSPCARNISTQKFFCQALAEVTVEETFETFAVTRFVSRHFVNGIVNCIQVEFFCQRSEIFFALTSTVLSGDADFEIFFG